MTPSDNQDALFPNPRGEQAPLPTPNPDGETSDPSPLDLPQQFAPATSHQVRDEIQKLVHRDLLGPWDGDTERIPGLGPRERYLVGMLGPKHEPVSTRDEADRLPDTETGTQGDGAEPDLPDVVTPQTLGRIWASSMGLSFAVPGDVDLIAVTGEWGRYHWAESEDEDGHRRRSWTREPVTCRREIRLDAEPSYRLPLTGTDADQAGVLLAVAVRPRDGERIVEVALVNNQAEPATQQDVAWLFQTRLTVSATDGQDAIFLPVGDTADSLARLRDDREEAHLRLLYRHHLRYATGRNVAVHASVRPGERRAHSLHTTWLPSYDVPTTVARVGEGTPLSGVELSMDNLATVDVDTLRAGLTPLVNGYRSWLDEREAEIPDFPEPLRPAAEAALRDARRIADRIRTGISLLTSPDVAGHEQALDAFRFANRAMALQRRHTEIARQRAQHGLDLREARARVAAAGASAASWYPFQLAFVLLNLPSLTDPAHPERAADPRAVVDLLFFPTGGGKTEAYLGLTAYTFAIRRLQGVVGAGAEARDGNAGVAVLMRYTLRLLTAQQFQRAAALVCATEVIRQEDPDTWGAVPFRIGLWVGGGVSPNWFEEAAEQIADARDRAASRRIKVLQTLTCPWCGTTLRAHRDLQPNEDQRRVFLYCPNAEGDDACPFSRTRSEEGLPILTVDEEIHRYAPSLIVATVDKLAQLPWQGYAGVLFGRVREHCPRHGYRHSDLDVRTGCRPQHNSKGPLPKVTSRPVVRLRPPDLIIQDELHLISGALGTTVGLFEAAVDQLCTWRTPDGADTGPKIVASTATTKRAREQVLGVFARDLAVFPPPVTDVADTFFSRQVPVSEKDPGRRYLGLCAHGIRLKQAEIRLAEILLLAGQTLFDRYGEPADPYLTLVGYFNATRELAGMRRSLDDQVTTRVRYNGRRRGLADRIVSSTGMLTIAELTSRISSADISDVLKRLEISFDPEIDTSQRRRAIADEWRAILPKKEKPPAHPLADRSAQRARDGMGPADVVLATSMLQVGVDVSRFGLMVVTGQPKNTAEYIQASSRVGRDRTRPGLVITLYNWTRPRDLAHYEDFEYYHATFYRQVEALSVTPYTRRALDRGTAATFIAAVRNADDSYSRNVDAHDVPLDGPVVRQVTDRLLARARAVAGERGAGYLEERLNRIKDEWHRARASSVRIGYERRTQPTQQLRGLLQETGSGAWSDLTVGRSMRETENEINLLVPGSDELFQPPYGAPDWTFAPRSGRDAEDTEDSPGVDEFGESTHDGGRRS
jgi:hypothetical protein